MNRFIEEDILELLSEPSGFSHEQLLGMLKPPKEESFGDYAFPAFALAKSRKMPPPRIAEEIAAEIEGRLPHRTIKSVNAVSGFVNFSVDPVYLASILLPEIQNKSEQYGSSNIGQGGNVVIDLSSPNIAKPFHVGHLRSTVVGSCIYRIYEKIGYNCVGINHLGDWGTQFGKLIVAYKRYGQEISFDEEPIFALLDLYIRFHKEARENPELEDQAREEFRKLEKGDPEATKIWKMCLDYSMEEYRRIYDILNSTIDYNTGESFYNDKMEDAIKLLEEKGLTEISRDALIVNLEQYNLGAALLKRSDEATLYLTRDIAALLYRKKTFEFKKMLYVVGSAQAFHFQQLFKIIELMGYDWHKDCHHVEFGWIKFGKEMMSTREGNIVFLNDVIDKATQLAHEIILDKNPEMEDIDQAAMDIGVGAIIYADLNVRRNHDISFDWDDALNFDGNTGPYLQYTHTRLASLERKYGQPILSDVDFSLIHEPEEKQLLMALYKFPQRIKQAADEFEPSIICTYLFELSQYLNGFYQKHRVISDDPKLSRARMLLMHAVRIVMAEGLRILGLKAMEKM